MVIKAVRRVPCRQQETRTEQSFTHGWQRDTAGFIIPMSQLRRLTQSQCSAAVADCDAVGVY